MHQQHGRILQDDNPQVLQELRKLSVVKRLIPSANVAFLTACRLFNATPQYAASAHLELSFDAPK
jgi:hypothetical protein